MLCSRDISNGKEKYPISFNEDLCEKVQAFFGSPNFRNFQYVKTNVPGPGCDRELLFQQFVGCTCKGQCMVESCSCLKNFGSAYVSSQSLKENFVARQASRPILECGNECSCSKGVCNNRVVQNGAIVKFCLSYYSDKGLGLKIMESLSRLSFVCEYAGEIIDRAEAKKRLQASDKSGESNYLICLKEHTEGGDLCTFIDPKHVGNMGRFINHSCDPNLVMLPVRINHSIPRLALFSRRDLAPGEELTFDYSGCATFTSGLIEASSSSINAQFKNQDISTASRHERKQSNLHRPGHPRLQGVSKSSGSKYVKRKQKSITIDDTVGAACSDSHVKNESGSHFSVTRKPCFCKSRNCQKFLPYDSI